MKISPKADILFTLFATLLAPARFAAGQTAAAGKVILVGLSAEFSGQSIAKEGTAGAQAYFNYVNKRGGIFDRRIELKSYDDGRDIKRTVQNTEKLINEDKVFALFGYRSTPSVEAALPILTAAHVPLIAPMSGAQQIREPLNPLVFNLRASYQDEARQIIEQLDTVGFRKIAILYQDDPFGKDALAGFQKYMKERKLVPLIASKYDRRDLNVSASVKAIAGVNPQAIVMGCTPKACADFIKQIRATGLTPQFFLLSNVTSDEFVQSLGKDGWGVGISQVVPYPWGVGLPLLNEFRQAIKDAAQPVPISYASFEGFIAAKLLGEGLRLAGPNPTREKLAAALEGMRDFDLGGFTVRYSPTQHNGSSFVDLTVIGKNGKIMR